MFAAYPVALFIPYGYGYYIFNFFFPAFLLAGGISAAFLAFLLKKGEKLKLIEISFLVLFAGLLLSTFINEIPGADFLTYSGIVFIPLAMMLAVKVNSAMVLKAFQLGAVLLWLVNIIHCYHKLPSINHVGICGNQNWLSALVISTLPFVIMQVQSLLAKLIPNKISTWLVSGVICSAASIPVLLRTDSRATMVAVIAIPIYLGFLHYGKKVKALIAGGLLLSVMIVPMIFSSQVEREKKRNVRLALWTSSLEMVMKNPMGVGPGNFENRFQEFASQEQKLMLVSASTTEHPHNEFLHVLNMAGIAGGVFWLILVGLALFSRPENKKLISSKFPYCASWFRARWISL